MKYLSNQRTINKRMSCIKTAIAWVDLFSSLKARFSRTKNNVLHEKDDLFFYRRLFYLFFKILKLKVMIQNNQPNYFLTSGLIENEKRILS